MIKNYLITGFRNLKRSKSYTFINIFGLALGISSALVLFKFISFHRSFDKHHSNYDNIYRFVRHEISANRIDRDMGVPQPFGGAFSNDYPDVGLVTKVVYVEGGQFTITDELGKQKKFLEDEGIAFVEQSFFKVFDFNFIAGNQSTALTDLNQIVLSLSLVEKYFGFDTNQAANALGKVIKLDNKVEFKVSGVMEDPPQSSDFPFTALITYDAVKDFLPLFDAQAWGSVSSNANVFLLKNKNVSVEDIELKLKDLVVKYQAEEAETEEYHLQALSNIHFSEYYDNFSGRTVSRQELLGPVIIGIFLIVTACINFINLATAQAVKRAKEVGVRKVLGGSRVQLLYQFMSETVLITLFSVLISLGIAELALNRLEWLIDYRLTLDLLNDTPMQLYLLSIIVMVSVLAGLYPSFVLSSLKPVDAMKKSMGSNIAGKMNLRRGLVIIQFGISQFLVICTLVVVSQIKFFYNTDLGFEKESIITFDMPERNYRVGQLLKSKLMGNPNIESISFNLGAPRSNNNLGSNFNYEPLANDTDFDAQFKVIDDQYLDLYGIKLLAGRNLTAADSTLENALITETVMNMLGFESPDDAIGKKVKTGFSGSKNVVGVVSDFHAHSLKVEITPLFLVNYPGFYFKGAVKVTGNDQSMKDVLAVVNTEWDKLFPEHTFDYDILAERVKEDYKQEADVLTLFQIFSGIAILIGCLGLYGLVSFMANQRTKEIGIRKVLGASIAQILRIFSRELMLLISVAFVLAIPIGYYFMDSWLNDFEYRINMSVWMFAVAVAFTLVIAGITTGVRSLRAANANPVDSLRSE